MTITEHTREYHIHFKFNPRIVELIKSELPDRRWDPDRKCWTVPKHQANALRSFARTYGFRFAEAQAPEVDLTPPELPELEREITLKMPMYPYQARGVAYAIQKKRLIIGDKPGLGKTVQAIAAVYAEGKFPCLVICPSSLKNNWKREWEMWTDKRAMVMDDRVRNTWDQFWTAGLKDVFIVNYESLKKFFVKNIRKPEGKPLRLDHIEFNKHVAMFASVIIDESHRVKDIKTQQTKFSKGICQGKDMILLCTGTPVINKPKDLVAQLGIIDQLPAFGGYKAFVNRYCAGSNGASNLKELGYKLRTTCFYQRDKKDVLKDLPEKTRQIIICDITNRAEYAAAEADLMKYLVQYKNASDEKIERAMRGEIMVRIGILQNVSARGKIKAVEEYVGDLVDSGEKFILFAHLKEVVQQLRSAFPGSVTITGDDSSEARDRAVTDFQKCGSCGTKLEYHRDKDHEWEPSNTKLIICSIKAAGVGLTLTAASRVGFIEFPWTAADCDQCEDRAHRIGQRENVQATYFLGKDTIDERIYEIIQEKRKISQAITGTQEEIEENIIDNIINLFNQPKQ